MLQRKAQIGNLEVPLLIDGGASHNFINSKVVANLGLVEKHIGSQNVESSSRNQMKCEALVRGVNITIQ